VVTLGATAAHPIVLEVPPFLAVQSAQNLVVEHEALFVSLPIVADVDIECGARFVIVDVKLFSGWDCYAINCGNIVPPPEASLRAPELQKKVISLDLVYDPISGTVCAETDGDTRCFPLSLLQGAYNLCTCVIERKPTGCWVEELF
jgi:hypothetical protein